LVVVGGGAAGFFCAINAARLAPGMKVVLVEKASKVLQKVKVSGGGRCNVTHACDSIDTMASHYPRGARFVRKLFHQFFVPDTIAWFEKRGVPLNVEDDGSMFPHSNQSESIIGCLLGEANMHRVEIWQRFDVCTLEKKGWGWRLKALDNREIEADYVCLACGGFPKLEQFDWIVKATGHRVESPVPSLFTFNLPNHPITKLMGIATAVRLSIPALKKEAVGQLLITHWGLSGPAVLRLSAFAAVDLHAMNYQYTLRICWLPGMHPEELRNQLQEMRNSAGSRMMQQANAWRLPARLWTILLEQAGIDAQQKLATVSAASMQKLIQLLMSYEASAQGKTTYKEEFVSGWPANC
jgi:hypothetical protein